MANQFATVEYDKFTDVTKISMDRHCSLYFKLNDSPLIFGRLVFAKNKTSEILSLEVKCDYKEWMFLKDGNIIINIDDKENITLEPSKNYSYVDDKTGVSCVEELVYNINKDILIKLCKAEKLDFKISGKRFYVTSSDCERDISSLFITYCRRFYNAVYDKNAYTESLVEAAKSSGCMIATLIGVASLAAMSSGAYYLISILLG